MAEMSDFLHGAFWEGWRRWAVWLVCIGAVMLLGWFRTTTDAELAFASFTLFPVLFIAWTGGKWNGLFMAFLGAAMWAVGDIVAERQFSAAWIPWVNAATRLFIYSLVAILAAQVCLQYRREHEQASCDALTGLLNRRTFLEAGKSETERSKRYARPLTVVFLDLDDFKQLNDTMGHDAGDAALQATARALCGTLRSNDRVARLGGDEFAILLPEIGYDEAAEAGRKILVAVNGALQDFPQVGSSVGVAWFGETDRTFPAMLKAADELMYEVKAGGKNNLCCRRISPRGTKQPPAKAGGFELRTESPDTRRLNDVS
ncbi:MAG: diguanylate cyclase [Gallionella sp.]